jgi:ABC-type dipeptide/oligopeptide/nickel transport system permease subunit
MVVVMIESGLGGGASTLLERLRRLVREVVRRPSISIPLLIILMTLLGAVLAPYVTSYSPTRAVPGNQLLPVGTPGHLLGTDQLGRDVLTRILYGSRVAWQVGLLVSIMSIVSGVVLGGLSFYASGWLDSVVSRFIDGVLAFPALLLALILAAILGPSTRTGIIALAIVYTPLTARVMRSAVLSERQLDYVSVSRGLGNREIVTLVRHVFINTVPPMLVVGAVVASRSIIIESSLSFLGAGTQPPTAAWGLMIGEARELMLIFPMLVVVPAVVLSGTVLAINLFADAVGDALDVNTRSIRGNGRGAL